MSSTSADLRLIEVSPGRSVPVGILKEFLPDVETALFFGKAYDLPYHKLSELLVTVFDTNDTMQELLAGDHSQELQDYMVETVPEDVWSVTQDQGYEADVPHAEILPEVWRDLEVTIAKSVADVAVKLEGVLDRLPGKTGAMVFKQLAGLNKQRPTLGQFNAHVHHKRQGKNLVVLDVSGSMTESTIRRIVDEVVALAYEAEASLAIVSDSAMLWDAGNFDSDIVLASAEFSGTHYEKLTPILDQDWDVVVSVADYDSSTSAKTWVGANAKGRIGEVLDISLVNRPTFLAEVLGTLADKVTPILIGSSHRVLNS